MRSLVEQLTTAGLFGYGTPLAVVAGTSTVAVATANIHQRTNLARSTNLENLLYGGVIAMVITGFEHFASTLSRLYG